jgi:ubiquinone/menaquinone biosynthesis C-methylase UbiE
VKSERASSSGPLGDSASRDYSRKLQLFNAFAGPELRSAIANLGLRPGMRVLDAGCGTGEVLRWLAQAVEPDGLAVGVDLSAPHLSACQLNSVILQADLSRLPLRAASLDFIWCVNTIHHLPDPPAALRALGGLLRTGGRIALGQSSFLPDMYFAWDSRLERLANEAVRRYYREKYGLQERDLASVRALVGLLRKAGFHDIEARTFPIDRIAPVNPATEAYLLEAIFRNTWGERLKPYLSSEDYAELIRLCDPQHANYALRREDFHFIQTFTLVVGSR